MYRCEMAACQLQMNSQFTLNDHHFVYIKMRDLQFFATIFLLSIPLKLGATVFNRGLLLIFLVSPPPPPPSNLKNPIFGEVVYIYNAQNHLLCSYKDVRKLVYLLLFVVGLNGTTFIIISKLIGVPEIIKSSFYFMVFKLDGISSAVFEKFRDSVVAVQYQVLMTSKSFQLDISTVALLTWQVARRWQFINL